MKLTLLSLLFTVFAFAAPSDELFQAINAGDAAKVKALVTADRSLAAANDARGRSAVTVALFRNSRGFFPPRKNEVLRALLAAQPELTFFEAAGIGDVTGVKRMLAKNPALANEWHPIGWHGLHFAGFSGNAEVAKLFLDRGADPNLRAKTRFRNTPLQTALLTGQYDTAKLLLEHGADPLVRQAEGFTPMHEATLLGRRDLVDLLLAHGAELNSRADDGRTPLTEALRNKHAELAEYLRAKGATGGEITADLMKSPE